MKELIVGSLWVSRENENTTRMILAVVPAFAHDSGVFLVTYHDVMGDFTASVIATEGDWTYDWERISP
jgi:hypothetical protein